MRKLVIIGSLLFLGALPAAAQTQQPIRVNCGGPAYTDSKGQLWLSDQGFDSGNVSSIAAKIAGTSDPTLFQTGRYDASTTAPMIYSFAVPGGSYHVNLYFAETYALTQHVGARVFNVKMQDNMVFQNLDIFAAAGASTALVKSADITVTNGTVKIEFDNIGVQTAKVNAIEILQTAAAPEMKLSFAYPDGTPVTGTLNYTMSTSLLSLGGNTPLSNGTATCYLFTSPAVMGLAGQFQVNLSLTDTAGHTLWQVGMAMNPANVNFGSVQSSSLNVVVQKM